MRRSICALFLMLSALVPATSANAASNPSIAVSVPKTVAVGSTFKVDFVLGTAGSRVNGVYVDVSYDSDVITLSEVSNPQGGDPVSFPYRPGTFMASFIQKDGHTFKDGPVVQATFRVKGTKVKATTITLLASTIRLVGSRESIPGSPPNVRTDVQILPPKPPVVSPTFELGSATQLDRLSVIVSVNTKGETNVTVGEVQIRFDPDHLNFQGYKMLDNRVRFASPPVLDPTGTFYMLATNQKGLGSGKVVQLDFRVKDAAYQAGSTTLSVDKNNFGWYWFGNVEMHRFPGFQVVVPLKALVTAVPSTPTSSVTPTPKPTTTATPSPTQTVQLSATPTVKATDVPKATSTPTLTITPSPTATEKVVLTANPKRNPTVTNTPTTVPSATPTTKTATSVRTTVSVESLVPNPTPKVVPQLIVSPEVQVTVTTEVPNTETSVYPDEERFVRYFLYFKSTDSTLD